MFAKCVVALVLLSLQATSFGGELTTIFDAHPFISLDFGAFSASVTGLTNTESYSAHSNANGAAELGPCSFGSTPTGLSITSGGWRGEIGPPAGRATGSLDCRTDFTLQLLGDVTGHPPGTMDEFYSIATHVSFDPLTEMAQYGWTVSLVLTSLDSGSVRRFGEFNRSLSCGVEPFSPRFTCDGTFDFNSAQPSGFEVGDRFSGQLVMDLFFDLQRVPEPSSLLLFTIGALALPFLRWKVSSKHFRDGQP